MAEEKKQKPVPTQEQSDLNGDSEYNKKIKDYKKQAARSFVLAFTTLIAIIAVCIAWFVSNNRVSITGASVSAEDSTLYTLASVGVKGAYDDNIPTEFKVNGQKWKIGENTGTSTDASSNILWCLNDKSNIGNVTSENSQAKGISPGSCGKLQFYVIPKVENIKIKFQLNIVPLKVDADNNIIQYSDDERNNEPFQTLGKLLKGHLLFSYLVGDEDLNNKGFSSGQWIKCSTGQFEISFDNKKNIAQLVTLYWQWPYQWSEINATLKDEIIKTENYKTYFFSDSDKLSSPDNSDVNASESENDSVLNSKYNNADKIIGDNVTWLLVQLLAEPS